METIPLPPLEIYHGSPKQLVVVRVVLDDVVVTSGYKVCFRPRGSQPLEADVDWIDPESAGTDTGVFVGTETSHVFAADTYGDAWYFLTDTPEKIIDRVVPGVRFTRI